MDEMEHLRQVLDYMPCNICENVVPEEERRYMCSICARINRIVSADRAIPKWRVDEDGKIVAAGGMDMEELKPSIRVIEEREEEREEEKIEIEVLEVGEEIKDEELTIEEHLPEWEAIGDEVYRHGDYILYTKEVILRGNRKQRIYFFSKKELEDATPSPLPDGYEVGVNRRTGLPYLRKKK